MRIRVSLGIVVFLIILVFLTSVYSLTGSDLAASLELTNAAPIVYSEVEPTDPSTYTLDISYQFQVSVCDGAETISKVIGCNDDN